MNTRSIDLNLIRLFDAIYRLGSVSKAAMALDLSQPAASQGLSRLRVLLRDALFVRTVGGMRPTPRAQRLAMVLCPAMSSIEGVLAAGDIFNPLGADTTFKLHLSDIGEARLLPKLVDTLDKIAPNLKIQSVTLNHTEIAAALASGTLDFALGFLPDLLGTDSLKLLDDEYAVVVHSAHPIARRARAALPVEELFGLNFAVVMSHRETTRIIRQLGLESRVKLTCQHFLALPSIVAQTSIAVIMPLDIARKLMPAPQFTILDTPLPGSQFSVSLHWDKRFAGDPANIWFRRFCAEIYQRPGASAPDGIRSQ